MMFGKLKKFIIDFYIKEKELDIRLFKLLGTAGILVSLTGAFQDAFTSPDLTGSIINILAALASVCLMWFVHRSRKYLIGYLLTSVSVFMVLFAWLFLETGAMNGSIPYFFAFGLIFTLLMYKGKLMYIMEIVQIAFYTTVCIFSYGHPEFVTPFESAEKQFYDQLAGILLSAVGIGAIFLMYIHEYRKQQKIAEESSKAKSVLLANISHEIRTPINMLLGMNEMILRESENTQIIEYAQNVDDAGRHLLFMVNQFLDLSRIDMGKEVLFEENFNLFKLTDSLGAFFGKEAEKKAVEFVMDIDRKMPAYLNGDVRKLTQILSNLLSNAVKYTSKGTIVFSAQEIGKLGGTEDDDRVMVHFEVSDTGNGIAPEDQEKIFKSFERADIIRNRSIEGTGLGLAISNKLAQLMGTEIKLKSTYGMGSLFWVDICFKPFDENESDTGDENSFIAPEARVLAVDDNKMNLVVAKSLLKRTLVTVDTAGSAGECYEKYLETDYDIVLMDYMMPEIDGIEAMEHLRQLDEKRGRRTPIIVLTADATPEKKELFMSKGFDDYLLKPVDSELLEKMLMKHLPQRLVTPVGGDDVMEIPAETRASFAALLKRYDISFELGLKHLSGDISQFARIARFFIENTAESIEKLKKRVESGDSENAAILVHSIKGNAGNVGGEDLYYSARRLERRAKDNDREYVDCALPLFIMKWKRVVAGLEAFLEEFEKLGPNLTDDEDDDADEQPMSRSEVQEALLEAIRLGNQTPALDLIDELAAMDGESETLDRISEYIKNIEFEKAEELIRTLEEGGEDRT